MKRKLPTRPDKWLQEIRLEIAGAQGAVPFGSLIGESITGANLFYFASLVCLKFRGMDFRAKTYSKRHARNAYSIVRCAAHDITIDRICFPNS